MLRRKFLARIVGTLRLSGGILFLTSTKISPKKIYYFITNIKTDKYEKVSIPRLNRTAGYRYARAGFSREPSFAVDREVDGYTYLFGVERTRDHI
jgi:hypothetical protein